MTTALPVITPEVVDDSLTDDELDHAHLICHCALITGVLKGELPLMCGKIARNIRLITAPDSVPRCDLCMLTIGHPCSGCPCVGGRDWFIRLP